MPNKGIYPAKLFEYLAARKPILALIDPQDVAAELVRQARCGFIAPNEDVDAIYQALREVYRLWKEHLPFRPEESVIRQAHRKLQVQKMEGLIDALLAGRATT
jgi:hypothetical protein